MSFFSSVRFYNIVFLLLITMAAFILWHNTTPVSSKQIVTDHNYDAFAIDVVSTQFSKEGTKQYELISSRLNHYKQDNQTHADNPTLYLYDTDKEKWLINAKYAIARQGQKMISFVQQVNISGAETSRHKNTQLLTEKISYYPENNKAHTEEPVTIIQPGSLIHATGMEVDFTTGQVSLNSNVNGNYNP